MATFTDADLDRLRTGIVNNELSVTFSDQTVTYRSVDDMIRAYEYALTEQARAMGRSRISYQRLTGGYQ